MKTFQQKCQQASPKRLGFYIPEQTSPGWRLRSFECYDLKRPHGKYRHEYEDEKRTRRAENVMANRVEHMRGCVPYRLGSRGEIDHGDSSSARDSATV